MRSLKYRSFILLYVEDSTRKLARMNRRQMLEKLSAMGVSAGGLAFITKDTLAKVTDNPDDEIPRLHYVRAKNPEKWRNPPYPDHPPEREGVYYTIPRDEWVWVEAPYDAANKVDHQLHRLDPTGLVDAGVTRRINGHTREPQIEVALTTIVTKDQAGEERVLSEPEVDEEEVREAIPTKVDGTVGEGKHKETLENIPVKIVSERIERHYCNDIDCGEKSYGAWFNADYSDIPGGCQIHANGQGRFTACTPAYDNDYGEMVMTTAAHGILDDGEDYDDAQGRDIYQSYKTTGQYIGDADKMIDFSIDDNYDRYIDAATIRMASDVDTHHKLADTGGDYAELIQGSVSYDRLRDMESNYASVCRQGRTTGRCSGYMKKFVDTDRKSYFKTTANSESGDSGGPHFEFNDDGYAVIAGIHYGGDSTAVPMPRIEDEMNIVVP